MKTYKITVNGRTYEVAVEESNASAGTAPVATVVSAAAEPSGAPAPPAATAPVTPAPVPVQTTVEAPQEEKKEAKPAPVLKGDVMKAPMPGTILSVKVKVGDPVKKGTVLCILEAMKMENEIQSGQEGIVTGVNVQAGQSVNAGDSLLSIG